MGRVRSIWMIARNDLRRFFRDRTGMLLGFLLPIALITVFGYVMKFAFGGSGGMPSVALWVADEDQTDASRKFVQALRDSEMIDLRPRPGESAKSSDEVRKLVADGEAHHALSISAGFGESLSSGRLPQLTLVRDPGRSMEDRIVRIGLTQSFMITTEGALWPASIVSIMKKLGMGESEVQSLGAAAQGMQTLISSFVAASTTSNVNEETDSEDGNGPARSSDNETDGTPGFELTGFLDEMVPLTNQDVVPPDRPKMMTYQLAQAVSGVSVMMLLFGMLACGIALIQERENGTLQRLLIAAVPRSSILWAKFVFAVIMGVIQLGILLVFGNTLFAIDAFRDPVTLVVLTITWAAAATSFGMLIAAWAKTTKQAEGIATLLILLMGALGGCWFPVQMMDLPPAAELVTQSTLTYWAMSAYQGMFWHQWSWSHSEMLTAIGVQWAFAAAGAAAAFYLFRRNYVAG